MIKFFLLFSSLNGALAVILGAFGAHGLKNKISPALFAAFQTGTHYHLFHVLALLGLSLLILRLVTVQLALWATGFCWILGVTLFSGSLYGLALGGPSWLGPITPIGGSLLIIGWVCLTIGIAQSPLKYPL
jgi:uncharacterized membrane protein YgdD (TMEM256/DUF423 family)